jgi:5-methylcytosine-specific restriction endonuclease McrA
MFAPTHLTRDHIIPVSRGGINTWMNVVTACSSCNKVKDNRTPEEAHMPLIYVPYAPNRAEYLILQNRKILGDQMEFLIKQVPKESRLLS